MSDKFEAAFAKADADGSGSIDLAEAKAFIKAFKPEVTDARVEEIFKKYDADNSGTLDKDECKKLATDMKLLG